MGDLLRAAEGGNFEAESNSGPSSYPTGGFSVTSDLGRIDEIILDAQNASWEAIRESTSDNSVVVGVYSQGTGTEAAAGTDLSGVDFTHIAFQL